MRAAHAGLTDNGEDQLPDLFGLAALNADVETHPSPPSPSPTDWYRVAGHELRTPVNGILGICKIMLREHDRSGGAGIRRTHLDLVAANALALSHALDDLLLLGRLQAGRLEVQLQTVDVRALVEEIAEAWWETANQRKLTLASTSGPPVTATSDQTILRTVLDRLVDNAIRYTPAGKVTIAIEHSVPDRLAITVTDDGPGIPVAEQAKIFEPFARGHVGAADGTSSAGLGLTVAARLTGLIQATVSIREISKADDGPAADLQAPSGTKVSVILAADAVGVSS